ncbi:XRE family transcriptional regulator [Vibrio sp. ES.051]|uniref:XRE family transcriptional regulator n=1 Tax=Vibrio sp. ES.051 TaxID=1761909 RepID=UPI000BF44DEB|nr:XRE family transcriptional regulator [Vibrio sp. ES.051]
MNGDSIRKFASKTDVSEGALRKILKGSVPNIETAAKIAINCGVSLDWLIMGTENPQEELHRQEEQSSTSVKTTLGEYKVRRFPDFNEEFCLVPGYHIQVSAGSGCNAFDEEPKRWLAFRRKYLKFKGLTPERCAVVFVKGDSMADTITDNDSLLIDTGSRTPIDGHIYVVRLGDELYAKRVQKSFDGSLVLISDNKDYGPITVPKAQLNELCIVGKVVQRATDL